MPTSLQTPQTLPVTGYTVPATLGPFQNLEKVVFQITGGVVIFQVGRLDGSGYPNFDQTEAALPPGIWGFDKIYGIRFRSRDSGSLATIDPCTGYFDDDPDPYNPGTIPGSTTAITGAVNFQHNEALVASQPTADFDDSALGSFVWTLTNDGPNNRVKIQPPDVVTSAFGRIGAVTAQTGDYVASQVTNAADLSSVATQTFKGVIGSTGFVTVAAPTVSVLSNFLLATDADPDFQIIGSGKHNWGPGGSGAFDAVLERSAAGILRATNTGLFSSSPTQGLGYATGAGGTVTQLTSFNTAVTLSTICGVITLFTSATTAGTVSTFTVTNTRVAPTDTIVVCWGTGTNPGALLSVTNVGSGTFTISWEAVSSQASSTRTINFAVLKSVNS